MAEIKISDLTPKGVNLAATDLLVISEDIGGGLYETKSITGDEVLNAVAKTAVAVRNQTGATIYKGTIVYISGASGGKALISKAQANSEVTSSKTLGVVTVDIANNANGNVLTNGLLTDLDTRTTATNPFTADTLAIGDDLYLSPTNAGYVTNIKPIAPNNLVNIGKVLETSATTGQILYAIVNGYELGELHDVDTTGELSGDVLSLNGGIWKPKAILSDAIVDGEITKAPTQNAVFDALALKENNLPSIVGNSLKVLRVNAGETAKEWATISTGLTIGTTPITSGTVGRVLFEGAGNVMQEDSAFFWDNTNKRLGIGATPATTVRLDVRAQGALSTDIAFRVRNSADTRNFLTVNGAGDVFNNGAGGVSTNTFFGENVGRNASGIRNTAFGNQSLLSNTTGVNNIALGTFAAYSNTTGVNNIGIGVQSLNSNSISSNNVALGNQSLFTNTAGENTALGNNSLYSNTTGTQNSSVGYQSSYSNSTGQQNIALGTFAMYSNTTGSNNVSLGVQSLNNKTFGSSNIALGFDSGRRISGGGNLTTANNSIFIGEDSRANADSQTNQIVIGHNAIGGGSNTATLGNTSIVKTILRGTINAANLPTSATGLVTGDIWNNGGVLNIV